MTERPAAFVELCVPGEPPIRSNATRAAGAAGFAWAGKQGPRLMTIPEVAERVEALFFARWIEPEGAMDPEIWLSRTLRDGHGYNEESTYVQAHPDVPNGVLA